MKIGDFGMSRFVGAGVVNSPQPQQRLSRNLTANVIGTAQVTIGRRVWNGDLEAKGRCHFVFGLCIHVDFESRNSCTQMS